MPEGMELIQQWQYLGKIHPILLEKEAFVHAKQAGLTSLQSYVYWAEIEKEPNIIDFSSYDVLVEKLSEQGLRWVPFLILGPYYATPRWFQESKESVFATCLEHGRESKIQSIWNPHLPKYVDRFLRLVAEHYPDHGIFESITLGISGNWGESLYPATGCFIGGFHTHPGWWCGDEHAMASFRQFAGKKYGSIQALNRSWGTVFRSTSVITFPRIKRRRLHTLCYQAANAIPYRIRPLLRPIWKIIKQGLNSKIASSFNQFHVYSRQGVDVSPQQRWYLDFIEWYLASMTQWAEFWVGTARKYFSTSKIYLVTGGSGEVEMGADFSEQTKMVTKYKAGLRITNQTDNYAESFIRTRLLASACRFYGAYFTTEEADVNVARGVTMRIFDAVSSGASGAYFKNIIGLGTDNCTGWTSAVGKPTQGATNLKQNLNHLTLSGLIIDVAVFFPNSAIALNPSLQHRLYNWCSKLRDIMDFDLVDEHMIADGALKKYRFLIVLETSQLLQKALLTIAKWVKSGGILITESEGLFPLVVDNNKNLPRSAELTKMSKGYILVILKGKDSFELLKQAIYNQNKKYRWLGVSEVDGAWDRVYATRFTKKILYYNSTNATVKKWIEIDGLSEKIKKRIEINPQSIFSIDVR